MKLPGLLLALWFVEQIKLWVYENFESVRLYTQDSAPVDLTPKHSGGRIAFTVNRLTVGGALLLQ
jgi:hypothetical protein